MNRRVMEKDFKKHLHGIHIYRLDDDNDLVLEKWTKDSGDPFPTKFLYVPYDLNEGDATAVGYTIIKDGKESKIESPTGMTASEQYKLTNFKFENLNIKAKDGEYDKSIIPSSEWNNVKVNQ